MQKRTDKSLLQLSTRVSLSESTLRTVQDASSQLTCRRRCSSSSSVSLTSSAPASMASSRARSVEMFWPKTATIPFLSKLWRAPSDNAPLWKGSEIHLRYIKYRHGCVSKCFVCRLKREIYWSIKNKCEETVASKKLPIRKKPQPDPNSGVWQCDADGGNQTTELCSTPVSEKLVDCRLQASILILV